MTNKENLIDEPKRARLKFGFNGNEKACRSDNMSLMDDVVYSFLWSDGLFSRRVWSMVILIWNTLVSIKTLAHEVGSSLFLLIYWFLEGKKREDKTDVINSHGIKVLLIVEQNSKDEYEWLTEIVDCWLIILLKSKKGLIFQTI